MHINTNFKIIVTLSVLILGAHLAYADEYTGSINTGNILSTGLTGTVIGPPIANPAAGTYNTPQIITLVASGSQSIRYTADGSTPDCASVGTVYSSGTPLLVSSSETVNAISCYSSGQSSSVESLNYTISAGGSQSVSSGGGGGGGGLSTSNATTTTTTTTTSSSASSGDINGDGTVDILDLSVLMSQWGQTGTGLSADLNGDGTVDILDFSIMMANWNG